MKHQSSSGLPKRVFDCYVCQYPTHSISTVQGAEVCDECIKNGRGPKSDQYRNVCRDAALDALHHAEGHRQPTTQTLKERIIRLVADLHHLSDACGYDLGDLIIESNGVHSGETWPNTWVNDVVAEQEQDHRKGMAKRWREARTEQLLMLGY